ncbi:unnamed protein product [Lota lota]
MAPQKLVIKCGNVAVLVDVHALPLGAREEDTSWLTAEHLEEVAVLVQDAVEQRVKQHAESLHSKGKAKHRKELPPATAFSATGASFNLVAHFLKRHFNLRCLVKHRYGELRVFPERCVVCVSRPQDASARPGNPSQAATERGEQSRSEYFSRVGGTQEPLNSSVKTKRSALQKIARQVGVRREIHGPAAGRWGTVHTGDSAEGQVPQEKVSSPAEISIPEQQTRPTSPVDLQVQERRRKRRNVSSQEPQARPHGATVSSSSQQTPAQKTRGRKRATASGVTGEPLTPNAKRTCLGASPGVSPQPPLAIAGSSQTSNRDHLPPPPPPPPPPTPLPPPLEAKAASTASPGSARCETTGEAELLTPGKRASRLPLTSNSTEQTNQNRLAASLRGLSVRPVSPGSAISSRPTLRGEEGRENVPRTSRLRRLKRT